MLLIQIKCVDLKWEVNRISMSIMCIADVLNRSMTKKKTGTKAPQT
jgi:hypothetical protein